MPAAMRRISQKQVAGYSVLGETAYAPRAVISASSKAACTDTAGDLGRQAVEAAIPSVPVDPEREQVARLVGQGGTVAGGNGAALVNQSRQDFGDVGEGLSRTGAVLAVAAVETKAGEILVTEGTEATANFLTKSTTGKATYLYHAAAAFTYPSACHTPDRVYSATFASHAASPASSSRRSRTISSSADSNGSNALATTGSYAQGETPKPPKTLTKQGKFGNFQQAKHAPPRVTSERSCA